MTDRELKIIAELFGTPCNYVDDYMQENAGEWCSKFCDIVDETRCWKKYFYLREKELTNKTE